MTLSGMIHRARVISRERAARNAQGEYESEPVTGAWFNARLMQRGGVNAKQRREGTGGDARVVRGYELLAQPNDENGDPVVLSASALVQTDCPLLGSPTLELSGEPEKLNNGTRHIGWMAYADKPKDVS